MNPVLNYINKIPRIHYPEKVKSEFIAEGVKTLLKETHSLSKVSLLLTIL